MKIENEKVIAGLSCNQVLDRLSDYLDGDLPAPEAARLEEHLRGCDGCARFGGEFRGVVESLRRHLARSQTLPQGFRDRLRKALSSEPPGS
ncbi:MAG TPA: anti-sigma factor [Anaeromyxobacteraceae bacterium]|nr:anti-sigma factor [Anaeromyxobacteraceae bacterium]